MDHRNLKLMIIGAGIIFIILIVTILVALFQVKSNTDQIDRVSRDTRQVVDSRKEALCPVFKLIMQDRLEHHQPEQVKIVREAYNELQCTGNEGK